MKEELDVEKAIERGLMVCILRTLWVKVLLLASASLSIAHYSVSELDQKSIQQINLSERCSKASDGNSRACRDVVMGL